MKFIYSFLILICISIITVKSQEENKFNYFQIKKDGDPESCRTHEEGDYALVELFECKRGCQGYIRIIPKFLLNEYLFYFSQFTECPDTIQPITFECIDPSNDFIKIGSSGFSVLCSTNKNITTPTPSETPTITETPSNTPSVTPNETTTPKPTVSNTPTPSPTPKPTETASNNPTESPAGNGSHKLSIYLSSLLVFLIISMLL
ncbi:hypothetical protein DICPUDRAFT_148939 [Dictyostelium purpureum]|uniref:Uncharacterized protein n=1 Tax=Dictyostelium purpureum TaxID=5786 RepID=F0ZCE0_DICPU|nr:uncharacterized protein DICPUDRAFT_148939 [Dictyostelium purpureum]EGC38405.1 hypothetical protein DICPUDRAFT_148939 [Dictyostelium purpureum]|eukprot:XP_003285066.1 hypothetical protein DICPUDRAFT_148939 [Dictyostelium purpureum]